MLDPVAQRASVWRWSVGRQHLALAVGLGLVGLGLALWEITQREFLSFYDAGVYVGAALHFVNGTLPYSRFTFVEPPGILLVLSPVALLSHAIGDRDALLVARVMSAVVSGVSIGSLAWLLRGRGRTAMFVAGLAFAAIPVAVYVVAGVKLDSYCVMLSLLSGVVAFGGRDKADALTRRHAIWAGVLMGAALSVKLFAFFPLVAAIVVLAARNRRRAMEFGAAAAVFFAVVSLPFFVASPRGYISQVFIDQIIRPGLPIDRATTAIRLKMLTGFAFTEFQPSLVVAVVVLGAAAALIAVASARRRRSSATDDFLALTAALAAIGLLLTTHTSIYYFYFPAPFIIGALVSSIARLLPEGALARARREIGVATARLVRVVVPVAAALAVFGCVLWSTTIEAADVWVFGLPTNRVAVLERQVPAGACVIYSQVLYGLESNRFTAGGSTCPAEVDSYGMWLGWGDNRSHPPRGFVRLWEGYFSRAQYAVLSSPASSNIPWTPELHAWFNVHFRLRHVDQLFSVYQRATP